MPLPDRLVPVRMQRVAVVALGGRLREALVALARAGTVELSGALGAGEGPALEALRRVEAHGSGPARAAATPVPVAVQELERRGAADLLAGEVELDRRAAAAIGHRDFAILLGWTPRRALASLRAELARAGAAVIELPAPRDTEPPSLLRPPAAVGRFRSLVELYGPVPYRDLDPTAFAAATYFLMFGMMFGDVGDGLLLAAGALALRAGLGGRRLAGLRPAWPFVLAAALCATAFGVLYGELFGPTGVLPTLWLRPLDDPVRLLVVAIGLGGVLLVASAALGTVNRWREGGVAAAVLAPSGGAGLALTLAAAAVVAGRAAAAPVLLGGGLALGAVAVTALGVGALADAQPGSGRLSQVVVTTVESPLRLFSNAFSFTRLGAFGLMHAAVGQVVFDGARGLWGGIAGSAAAAVVFVAGSLVALALEGLVVAIQAMRLEYYELFSRIFAGQGRPFQPWSMALRSLEEAR
jgi:V/A-type H+/Na+-transporting ATPase subunit I